MEDMCDFSKAKVGDKVWSIQYGDCRILKITNGKYPIIVGNFGYDIKGRLNRLNRPDEYPSLYWKNPNIVAPPPPKRMVKKEFEGWLNIYENGNTYIYK